MLNHRARQTVQLIRERISKGRKRNNVSGLGPRRKSETKQEEAEASGWSMGSTMPR